MTPLLYSTCVNTIKFLSADMVESAGSGHPGAPMGMADIAFVLWSRFLTYNPDDPRWVNRDHFVLSAGHASALLYSLLHLAGYKISLEDLKQFRQWKSKTPGHPEYHPDLGIECTTGPLGAGFGNAVGMALGAKMLKAQMKQAEWLNSKVYVLASDGDIQEGVSAESASLAGHWGLDNLIVIYDQNQITIGGKIELSMTEDVGKRFESYGWKVMSCDGHCQEELTECLNHAQEAESPTLIIAKTTIGQGSPNKAGTAGVHGAPLGADELTASKQQAGVNPDLSFHVPQEVREVFEQRRLENQKIYEDWKVQHQAWKEANPSLAKQYDHHLSLQSPDLLDKLTQNLSGQSGATRELSAQALQIVASEVPFLTGGSADLEPSTKTLIKQESDVMRGDFSGRNIRFGIREHAMGSITNGLYCSGAWRPYCSTFLSFSDYMRASVRLAAISNIPAIFIFTHDSFYVGEDGPTHQPIEQLWSLRLIPNLNVWRPADATEVAAAWSSILENPNPSALILTRQNTASLEQRQDFDIKEIFRGMYIVSDNTAQEATPDMVFISTGSEGGAAQEAALQLREKGLAIRHVSAPCLELFQQQPEEFQETLLPYDSFIVAIEAGVSSPWRDYADFVIGRDEFGDSAPASELEKQYGFTGESIVNLILELMEHEE